jgi:hypothetical protein
MINFIRVAICAATLTAAACSPSSAGPADYSFEPVTAAVKAAPGAELAVRLVDKKTGKPVDNAVIFKTRLDMSPDGMEGMEAKIEPAAPAGEGVYKFKSDLTMAGKWALKLEAKVQGEPETVTGTVIFNASE